MSDEGRPFRVVVGVDGSEDARAAAELALREAQAHGGTLVVVHAWSLPAVVITPEMLTTIRLEDFQGAAEQLLADEVAHLRSLAPEVDIETRLEYGPAVSVLLAVAGDASMIVVGSRGAGRVAGLLLGSVSQAVVTRAHCPVLVVPPGDDGS